MIFDPLYFLFLAPGVLLGMCTLFSFMAQCRRAELGYGFAKHAWGLGYMRESVGALLQLQRAMFRLLVVSC